MKRFLSLAIALAMLAACGAALAETPVNPKGVFPIVDEPITLTVWCNLPTEAADGIETNDATVWLEEKTNIHINWEKIGINEAAEKLRVMMAANSGLPDVVMTANVGSIMTTEQVFSYGMQGLLLPLNDYIEEYGDAWYDAMEVIPWGRSQVTAPDGNIYGLGGVNDGAYHVSLVHKFYVNNNWLEALSIEPPTTIDEFYDMLVAFRDNDPNGNGIKDEVPLSGSIGRETVRTTLDYFLMNAFQYSTGFEQYWLYLEEPDKVASGAITPGYQEGLRWFRKLYEENLMDKEIFINTQENMKMLSGAADGNKLGSFSAMFAISGASTDNPDIYDYIALSPLEGPAGRVSVDCPTGGASYSYLITHTCKNPEAAFRMGDYLMTIASSNQDTWEHMVMRYGLEGAGWAKPSEGDIGLDGNPALFTLLPGPIGSAGTPTLINSRWYEIGPAVRPMSERNAIATAPGSEYNIEQILFDETKNAYEPFRVNKSLPVLVYDAEDIETLMDIQVNIQNYGQEAIAQFVTGQMDIDKDWDLYVQTMYDLGLQTLIDVNQKTLDKYLTSF
ncbi:MAG: extracellular solute-binding protein [Oscillospiraceae bacterium]|jgi:putative aldouronate transport system substrate-binding protein|nr:extracellular solute-binding protein [Oscillospiraceae bacterium]